MLPLSAPGVASTGSLALPVGILLTAIPALGLLTYRR